MHKIWFLLLPGFLLVDLVAMIAIFKAANSLRRTRNGAVDYRIRLVCAAGGPVHSSSGIALFAGALPRQLIGRTNSLVLTGALDAASTGDWLASAQRLHEWLSDGRRHLRRCALLGSKALMPLVPGIRLVHPRKRPPARPPRARTQEPVPFTLRERTRGWQILEPGQGAGLALSWVEQDSGAAFADAIALRLSQPRPPRHGARRHRGRPIEQPVPDPRIVALHSWISTHLRERISVAMLAQQIHMSTRSFARFYRRATGVTPGRGVQQVRLEMACRLIGTSTRPLKTIAAECGYGSQEVMRRVFLRSLQMTPIEYRRRHAAAGTHPFA